MYNQNQVTVLGTETKAQFWYRYQSQHDGKGALQRHLIFVDVRIGDTFAIMLALGSVPEISIR